MATRAAKAAMRSMLINKWGLFGSQMETDAGNRAFGSFYSRGLDAFVAWFLTQQRVS